MLRFAAAVLAVAAIAPTPAEQGLARLSEALASPAAVNDDVLGTRCGVLAKMAPHPAVLKIDTMHKCSGVLAYATILDPSWPCSLLSDGRAFHTGDSRPPGVLEREMQGICRLSMLPPVAGAVDHALKQLLYPHAPHKWLAASDRDSPGVPRRLLLSKDRVLHTGDSRLQEVEAVDLRPLVAGAVDHALKQRLYPLAPHQWLAASGRDSPGLSDKDGDGAGELSTHWA